MRFTLLLIFSFAVVSASSQSRIISTQEHLWLAYNGVFKLNHKFNLLTEYQWRRADLGKNWQQSLPRIGLEYKTKTGVNFAAGYVYATTYPYGDQPVPYTFNESRAWEQMGFSHMNGKIKFSHRYRLEQRWLEVKAKNTSGDYELLNYKYLNRLRYRFMANYTFKHFEKTNTDFFFTANDEVFVSFGKNVGTNFLDQNRLSASFGFTFKGTYTLTLGYLNQFVFKPGGIKCENNHTVLAGLTLNL